MSGSDEDRVARGFVPALPDGTGPHPGVVVIHEASGLNDNIRDICRRFVEQGYAALGVAEHVNDSSN